MSARSKKSKPSESEMSSSSRRTTTTSSVLRTGVSRQRSASPFNIARNEEKEELAHLNDRLAHYIDYVRKLELAKESLKRKIRSFTEERMVKNDDARNTYEAEIASLRRLVDDLAKQKAAAEVAAEKIKEDAVNARSKLTKRDMENRQLQRRIEALERELSAFKQDHDNYEALKPEYDAMEKRFEKLRRDLDAETLLRSDLENKLSGMREELDFKNRLLDDERNKVAQRTLVAETEIEDRKAAEYESRLYDQLQSYRDQTADDLMAYKTEMEHTFENKLNQLRSANTDASRQAGKLREELLVVRKHADDLEHELAKKESEVDLLKRRVDELERFLRQEREDYENRLVFQREEVERLQRELEQRFAEFADLMNTKVALDQEILMYRKMLEGEESRLHISTSGRESAFAGTGAKRRRLVDVDYDDEGEIEEDEGVHSMSTSSAGGVGGGGGLARVTYRVTTHSNGSIDFAGDQADLAKHVKLLNVSDEETNIGNWVLKQQVNGSEVSYKFHRAITLKPGATCQVWSSDSGAQHDPPNSLVMKNQTFKTGGTINFTLIDNHGEEQASCQIVRGRVRSTGPQLRSQSTPVASQEKCNIM